MDNTAVAEIENSAELKPKTHFTGKVAKIALAGAVVDLGEGKLGVLHISQILAADPGQQITSVDKVLQIGQEIDVWVRRVKDNRIELTMFKPLELDWKDIKKDMVVKGKVVRLEKFGAFVEIGAERPGLIHISEMAHGYVRQPSDVVKEEDEVEAMVLDVNKKKKQIKLSLKAMQPEPVKEEEPVRLSDLTPKRDKPQRKKKSAPRGRSQEGGEDFSHLMNSINEPKEENEPTAMEIAIREAMEKAKTRKIEQDEKKKAKTANIEQEDAFSRTLEQKARTA